MNLTFCTAKHPSDPGARQSTDEGSSVARYSLKASLTWQDNPRQAAKKRDAINFQQIQ